MVRKKKKIRRNKKKPRKAKLKKIKRIKSKKKKRSQIYKTSKKYIDESLKHKPYIHPWYVKHPWVFQLTLKCKE